ncbi:hypothetical protein BN2476_990003 [Paraburkholderia piptadeniae]|uniref:Uncharacterized protein n=1 Tax=Paraburkholderia piptadeniae TaxID=1701573 RepID=A0A1N7SU68_9BURK|nr:hypothetical protein BN2476_990003 [Paraburkholderia piptadeniae]
MLALRSRCRLSVESLLVNLFVLRIPRGNLHHLEAVEFAVEARRVKLRPVGAGLVDLIESAVLRARSISLVPNDGWRHAVASLGA